ncbi:hypothetical protein LXL04_039016 [Taraxacum kok-saghyz]
MHTSLRTPIHDHGAIATDPFPFPTTKAFRRHLRSTAFARRPALHDDDDLNPFPFPTTEAFRHHLRSTAFARRPALHDNDDDLNPHCVRACLLSTVRMLICCCYKHRVLLASETHAAQEWIVDCDQDEVDPETQEETNGDDLGTNEA